MFTRKYWRFGSLERTLTCKFPFPLHAIYMMTTSYCSGGGNAINAGMDRSRPPLRWMASQAKELGLRIGSFKRELLADEQIELRESLTGPWHLFEMLPFQRLTLSRRSGKINSVTRKCAFCRLAKGLPQLTATTIQTPPLVPSENPRGPENSFFLRFGSDKHRVRAQGPSLP